MQAENYLRQIQRIDVIIANRESDRYPDEQRIAELKERREEIIRTLENLPLHEYTVLYEIFVNGCMVKELPTKFGRSKTWVGDTKRQALDHLQHVLDMRKVTQ
jgi:DNA-directed RNA polymerase specialized sigma24 family protein